MPHPDPAIAKTERPEPRDLGDTITELVRESQTFRRQFAPNDTLDENLRFYLGDQLSADIVFDDDYDQTMVINKVMGAILASVAVQTELPVAINFQPRDTSDQPLIFLAEAVGAALYDQVRTGQLQLPVTLTENQLSGYEPITPEAHEMLLTVERQTLAENELGIPEATPVIDPTTQQPAYLFTDEDFIVGTDDMVAQFEQKVFQAKWDQACGDQVVAECVLASTTVGMQPLLVEYDDRDWTFDLRTINPKRCYLDPAHALYKGQSYVVWDELISEDEAVARFPHLAEHIHAEAMEGAQSSLTEDDSDWGETDAGIRYGRPMIAIRTAIMRWQAMPATEHEAVRYGLVEEVTLPIDIQADVDGGVTLDDDGLQVYVLPDDPSRTPVTPDDDAWPIWPKALRQVRMIAGEVVDDRRCPYCDIPLTWTKCLPIPGRPWGLSMTSQIAPIQTSLNLLASEFLNHAQYYGCPGEVLSASAMRELQTSGVDATPRPGRQVVLPDELFERLGGQLSHFQSPPALPASLMQFFDYLLNLADEISGQPDLMRGQANSSATSGRAIEALQGAARGVFGYLSRFTQNMVAEAARVMLGAMRDMMPEDEWMRCCGEYPVQVVRAIKDRAKSLEYDIDAQVASGGGATKREEGIQARADYASGLRARLSTMQKIGVPNPEAEAEQIAKEQGTGQPQPPA